MTANEIFRALCAVLFGICIGIGAATDWPEASHRIGRLVKTEHIAGTVFDKADDIFSQRIAEGK